MFRESAWLGTKTQQMDSDLCMLHVLFLPPKMAATLRNTPYMSNLWRNCQTSIETTAWPVCSSHQTGTSTSSVLGHLWCPLRWDAENAWASIFSCSAGHSNFLMCYDENQPVTYVPQVQTGLASLHLHLTSYPGEGSLEMPISDNCQVHVDTGNAYLHCTCIPTYSYPHASTWWRRRLSLWGSTWRRRKAIQTSPSPGAYTRPL